MNPSGHSLQRLQAIRRIALDPRETIFLERVDIDALSDVPPPDAGVIRLGVSQDPGTRAPRPDAFDILLCSETQAARPWVSPLGAFRPDEDALVAAVSARPAAALALVQILRAGESLSFDAALNCESITYSMLLSSSEFQHWLRRSAPRKGMDHPDAVSIHRVRVERATHAWRVILDRANARNAVDRHMRDALVDAFAAVELDQSGDPLFLTGDGPSFCAGGDLDEFGSFGDPAGAHATRTMHSAARALHAIASRSTVDLHGACIGAGIEIPAAAGHVRARRSAFFRLPEVSMGLIPGAGGTVTIPARIGRHRAAFMALSGQDVDVDTALHWGLIDEIVE